MDKDLKSEAATQAQVEPEKTHPDWDKQKQAIDQLTASYKKTASERDELLEKLDNANKTLAQHNEKLQKIEQQVQPKADEFNILTAGIPDLLTDHDKIRKTVYEQQKTIAELKGLADQLVQERRATEHENLRNQVSEKILSKCDDKFGAKYRTAAKKLADKLVDENEIAQPDNPLDAYLVMEEMYARVKAADEEKAKTISVSDSGGGAVSFATPYKTGDLETVAEDMLSTGNWKVK